MNLTKKTNTTAVVLIPPEEIWEPIQHIRRAHDRQLRRWMPHVTLLYPFRPRPQFDHAAELLAEACRGVRSFQLELAEFGAFALGEANFTVWLRPAPPENLQRLHEALLRAFPDCDDTRRHATGFSPHLSVGQIRGRRQMEALVKTLQEAWRPAGFRAERISLIWRDSPPDDVFQVDRHFLLGR